MKTEKKQRNSRSRLDRLVRRLIREIKTAKIEIPDVESGESSGRCHYSKTGWAIQRADGSCTCRPVKAPNVRMSDGASND